MANHASALKRARQSEKRRLRNKIVKTRVKNVVKDVRAAMDNNDPEAAKKALISATGLIDKAAGKGVLHWRTASRKIARLSKRVNALNG